MNMINHFLSGAFIEALGWTLVHSIWQGALVAILVAVLMIILKKYSAKSRYLIYFTSLIFLLGISIVTFFKVYEPASGMGAELANGRVFNNAATEMLMVDQQIAGAQIEGFGDLKQRFVDYSERNFPLFVFLWMLGISFFLLKFLGGYAYSQRLRHYRTFEVSEYWKRKVSILSHKIGLYKSIRMVESALVKVPMVVGHLKPVILVPLGMLGNVPPQQIEAIITHELAHIYRRDYLFNLIQTLIDILFFYHPAVWWMSRNIRMEREHICDDLVVMVNHDSIEYARALASVQEMHFRFPVPAPALAGNKYQLLNRIHRMMNKPRIIPSFTEGFMSALIILAGIVGMSATAAISFGSEDLPEFVHTDPPGIQVSEPIQMQAIAITGIAIATPVLIPDTIIDEERDSIMVIVEKEMARAMAQMEKAMQARNEAMEKYQEATQHQEKATQEMMEKFHEQYQEVFEDLEDDLDFEFKFEFDEDCDPGNVYFYSYPWKPGVDNYWRGVRKYRYPHIKYGYIYSDEYHDAFEDLQELEEFAHPRSYTFFYDSNKTSTIIIKELRSDDLIGWEGDYVIEIDSKGLFINGEKKSKEAYKKYKRLYESLEDEKITADHTYKLIL